jgi:integral membrane sensor domain MASE1
LGGVRFLPPVFVAAYLTAEIVHAPTIFALGFSLGNTLETYIGFYLLQRFGSVDLSLNRLRDLALLVVLGGLIPAVFSATLVPLTLLKSGMITADILPGVMWQWWRADVLGIAFFTPIILVFAKKKSSFFKVRKNWEVIALWAACFVIGQSVFLGWHLPGFKLNQQLGLI